jgi:hypothetical protein
MELKLAFVRHGQEAAIDVHRVHVRCFAAWELER